MYYFNNLLSQWDVWCKDRAAEYFDELMLFCASLRKLGREGTDLPFKIYVPLHL